MSQIKVAWYVLRVKSMHSWPHTPRFYEVMTNRAKYNMLLGEVKTSYIYYNLISQGRVSRMKSSLVLFDDKVPK